MIGMPVIPWLKLAVGGVIVLAIAAAGWKVVHTIEKRGFTRGYEQYRGEQAARDLKQAQADAKLALQQMRNKERIDEEIQTRDASRTARVAHLVRDNRSLHTTIANLNSRPAPADPGAAGFAHEASVARTLLGQCQDRRSGVAEAAEGLRDQVIGLQGYVRDVCLLK